MDLADILRANGNDCAIIFVTVSTEHYARSYEINAVHYLVKSRSPMTGSKWLWTGVNRC